MTKTPTPQAAQKADGEVRVGRTDAPEEAQAERAAEAATDRMGLGYMHGRSGGDPMGDAPAPDAALRATSGGGKPLPRKTRSRMEKGFGRDFSHVRIHDGPAAAEGARAVGGNAYTLGSDIVFGEGTYQPDSGAGAALLSHELAHTLAPDPQPTIRRDVSGWEKFLRFFGAGTISDLELEDYLEKLDGKNKSGKPGEDTGAIEGDNDGDNKARAVVERKMHLGQPIRVRHLLIEEMLDGWVSEPDEEAIIQILEDADRADAFEIIELVGADRLQEELTGIEYQKYLAVRRKVRGKKRGDPLPGVPLDWKINYTISGAPNALEGTHGVFLRSLAQTPIGGDRKQLASDTSVTEDGQTVAKDVKHPRNKPGELAVDAAPGRIEGGEVIPEAMGPQQVKTEYPVVSHHFDTAEVLLNLVYDERQTQVKKEATTKTKGTTKGTEKSKTKGKFESKKTGKHTTTGQDDTRGEAVSRDKRVEDGRSVNVKKGKAVRKGEEEKKVDLKTKKKEESKVDLKTKTKSKDKIKKTTKTTGTNTTTGNININVDNLKFDGKFVNEFKGKAEVGEGDSSWAQTLNKLTKPLRKIIVEKVAERLLGPIGQIPADIFNELVDLIVGEEPEWVVTIDANGKGSVSGSISGKITGKWREVEKIKQTAKTKGTVKGKSTAKTKGTVKTKGKGSIKGTEKTKKREEEDSLQVDQGASRKVSRGGKKERFKQTTKVRRDTDIKEDTKGTNSSDTNKKVDLRHGSEAKMKGTDTNVFEAFFKRADLSVRLTGEKGRYKQNSKPGQRGGGGARPAQQKGTGK